jgi:hypothetical protein
MKSLSIEIQVGLVILVGIFALYFFAQSVTNLNHSRLDEQCMVRGQTWSCEYQVIDDAPTKHCYCHD